MENPGAQPSSDKNIVFLAPGWKTPPWVVRRRDKAARPARHEKLAAAQAGSSGAGGGVVRLAGVTVAAPVSGSKTDQSRSAVRHGFRASALKPFHGETHHVRGAAVPSGSPPPARSTPAAHVAPQKSKTNPRSKPPRPRLSAGRPCPARPSCLCALRGRRAREIRGGRGGQSGQGHRRLRRLPGPNLCRKWHYTPHGYTGFQVGFVSLPPQHQGNCQTKSKSTSTARGLAAAKGCHHSARCYLRRLKRAPPPHGSTLYFTERFTIGSPSNRPSPLRVQRPRPGAGYAGTGAGRKPPAAKPPPPRARGPCAPKPGAAWPARLKSKPNPIGAKNTRQ